MRHPRESRHRTQRTVGRGLAFALLAAVCGCSTVHPSPRPLEPVATAQRFEARRLTDPGLAAFAASRSESKGRSFPPSSWDLPALALAALYFSPRLEEARARVAETEAAEITACARPNPTISFVPEVVGGSFSGESPWTLAFALDVPIETAGKRDARFARALRATEVARLRVAEEAWAVRNRLRSALLDLLFAQRQADLDGREAALREGYRSLVSKRLQVGEASRPDVQSSEVEALDARAAATRAAGRVAEARTNLAAAISAPTAALDGASFSWPTLDAPPAPDALPLRAVTRAGLLHRLDVRRALAEYAETEAALDVEVRKQYPDIHLGPGYTFDQGGNKFALGLSVTLPIFDRNQGPIAEALARRRTGEARFVALQASVISQTETATARYGAAFAEIASARDSLAKLSEREAIASRSTEVGEADALSLTGIRVQRIAGEKTLLESLKRTQDALGALEDALQRPLVDDPTAPPLVPATGGQPK